MLIELRAESAGPACVVIGIGLNVALGETLLAEDRRDRDRGDDLAGAGLRSPQRNAVAAALVSACVQGLEEFDVSA